MSGRVTACVSCHTEPGQGNRFELVEAAVKVDLMKALHCTGTPWKSSIDFGRVVVPFGVFAQQCNPGVYRTVSKPLIYNMGFRVLDGIDFDASREPVHGEPRTLVPRRNFRSYGCPGRALGGQLLNPMLLHYAP